MNSFRIFFLKFCSEELWEDRGSLHRVRDCDGGSRHAVALHRGLSTHPLQHENQGYSLVF